MSFRPNKSEEVNMPESFNNLTARQKRFLENSWAKVFAEEVFPLIDEEPFRVLYSDKYSRPNTPVNVIIGALILKDLLGLSDDALLENLMLDPRYQYALHTTDFAEQPMSDKTLQRFRRRCYAYQRETGIDLIHESITSVSAGIAKLMRIPGKMQRMDSMMVEGNIRRLSRAELLYRCVFSLVRSIKRNSLPVPETMQHYLEPADFNRTFYHADKDEAASALEIILNDAHALLADTALADLAEYQVLLRCYTEQTIEEDGKPRLRTKEDGGMDSSILQNPADPDATYRKKAGKEHRGYAADLQEAVGENGSVVIDFQVEPNNYSDSQFLKDAVDRLDKSDEETTLAADGAYAGEENTKLAADKNIRLVPTALGGKDPDPILADFQLDEKEQTIERCPAGHRPTEVRRDAAAGAIKASFERDQCAGCPYKDQCRAKIYKKKSVVKLTSTAHHRAKHMKFMDTEKFRNLARLRNGIETIPSILRRKYDADRMPVRGLLPTRFFFGFKVLALNVGKLLTYRRGTGNYAQNLALAQ